MPFSRFICFKKFLDTLTFAACCCAFVYDRTRADDAFRCDADFIVVRRGIWGVSIASEASALSVLIGLARQIKRVFFSDKPIKASNSSWDMPSAFCAIAL